uniref:Uncharacterized protein n=1 Tax=Rhizophora mucronata TaxID=61149 RepID=A0A2P2QTJ7_RHIMU
MLSKSICQYQPYFKSF